jgi:hypothetical protein
VSLISNNNLFEIDGLSGFALDSIKKTNPKVQFSGMVFEQMDENGNPLIKMDPISNEPIRFMDKTGIEHYILEDPTFLIYDFKDISRLVIFEDTVENRLTKEQKVDIIKVGFAKKHKNSSKYDIVYTLPYEFIRKLDAFKVFNKLNSIDVDKIIKDTNSFYWVLNNKNKGLNNSIPKLKKFEDSLIIHSGISNYSYLQVLPFKPIVLRVNHKQELYNNKYEITNYDELDSVPKKIDFTPKEFKFFTNEVFLDEIIEKYQIEKFNYKLYNKDGSLAVVCDPITGEPLVRLNDKTGKEEYIYEGDKTKISYVYNDTPNIYLVYDFMYNDSLMNGQNNAYIESIIITKTEPDLKGELVTLQYDLYKKANGKGRYGIDLKFDPYIDKYVIKNYTQNLPFFVELDKQIKCLKRLNVNDDNIFKVLSKEFNLYQWDNHPQNLLGILPR